jgi:branched-chain amino acid transport system permease protein
MSRETPTTPPSRWSIPGWETYREWFDRRLSRGGRDGLVVAAAHLVVGLVLFQVVRSLPYGAVPGGVVLGNLLAVLVLYATVAPLVDPYLGWLREKWVETDANKLLIVIGHIVVGFFLVGIALGLSFNGQLSTVRSVFFFTAVYAMMVLALNLHWGYTGIFNIGVAGFMAVGVYTMAMLSSTPNPGPAGVPGLGLPLPIGILGGVLAAALVGLVAALPALRLRADYFAIVTVALSEIIRLTYNSQLFQEFTVAGVTTGTGGATGISMPGNPVRLLFFESQQPTADPALLGSVLFPLVRDLRVTLIPPNTYVDTGVGWLVALPAFTLDLAVEPPVVIDFTYVLVLVVFVAFFFWLLHRVGNSPFGRVLKAIREDEQVAQALGKDTRQFKIVSFMFGCGLMGLGGILWQGSQGFTNPGAFLPLQTFYIWIALIIGGAGSNTGSVLGGALFASLVWEGPTYVRRLVTNFVELGSAPNTFLDAVGPIAAGELLPFASYVMSNIGSLRLVFVGVLLVYLMQRRPQGLLGHRKETAATIPLGRPSGQGRAQGGDDE